MVHYWCLLTYICKLKVYMQYTESYGYTNMQPAIIIYVNLFKYYLIFIILYYKIFHKKLMTQSHKLFGIPPVDR